MARRLWTAAHPPLDGAYAINRNSPQARGLRVWIPDARGANPLALNPVTSQNASNTIVSDGTLGQVYSLPAGWIEATGIAGGVAMSGATWSVACWVNFNVVTGTQTVVGVGQVGGSLTSTAAIVLRGTIRAEFSGAGLIVDSGVTPVANTWYRVWYTCDSVGVASNIYVNGLQRATSGTQPSSAAVVDTVSIGRWHDAGYTGDTMNGQVSDARYYNTLVTPATIWQDYEPSTRYDLWRPLRSRRWFVPVVGGTTPTATDAVTLADLAALAAAVAASDSTAQTETAALSNGVASTDAANALETAGLSAAIGTADGIGLSDSATTSTAQGPADAVSFAETAVVSVALSGTDVSTAADGAQPSLSASDSAAHAEGTPSLSAALSTSDAGSLSDLASVAIAGSTAIAASDAIGLSETVSVAVALAQTDAATASDSLPATALAAPDTGLGSEGAPSLSASLSAQDIGTLAETASVAIAGSATILAADAIGLTETISLGVSVSATDSSTAQDASQNALGASDSAGHAEGVPTLTAALSAQDAVTLGDAAAVSVVGGTAIAASDSSTLSDSASVTVSLTTLDTLGLSESAAVSIVGSAAIAASDSAALSETISISASVASGDLVGLGDLYTAGLLAAELAAFVEQTATTVSLALVDQGLLQDTAQILTPANSVAATDAVGLTDTATVATILPRDLVYKLGVPSTRWSLGLPLG
ncbi:MAG: hypothetical protein NVSMB60_08020 [Mycobacterium sp.]